MTVFSNERLRSLRVGISSYTENEVVLDVIGNVNISGDGGSNSISLSSDGIATIGDVKITSSGIITSSNPGISTVVYYGDGSNLIGVSAFNVITQDLSSNPVFPTFASTTGVTSVGISSSQFVFIPSSGSVGLGITNPTSRLHVDGDGYFTGVITASTFSGNATSASYASVAGVATALQNSRTFEITGDIIASPISFNGTGNVSLAATIQPNSVALGTDTTGDYVQSISGTANQITVTGGTGEGSSPVISIPTNPVLPGNVTIANDLQVNHNLNVTGNITIGGTSAYIISNDFRVKDADIVTGFTTDSNGNNVSNDTTANHGGIAVASTEGSPLVELYNVSIGETNPATYKKIMWFKSGAFAGLNTDAWLINYAVGIGSTQFPSGTRLAAGSVQFTENDLVVVRNINASGVVTAASFVGNGSGLTDTISVQDDGNLIGPANTINFGPNLTVTVNSGVASVSAINTGLTKSVISYSATLNQTVFNATYNLGFVDVYLNGSKLSQSEYDATDGISIVLNEGASLGDIIEIISFSGSATVSTIGIGLAIESGIVGTGVTSIHLRGAGISTVTVSSGIGTIEVSDIATSVIGGIASVSSLNVSGVSTITSNSSIDALKINQTGSGNALLVEDESNPDSTPFVITGIGSVGIGTTNPSQKLDVNGNINFTGDLYRNGNKFITISSSDPTGGSDGDIWIKYTA